MNNFSSPLNDQIHINDVLSTGHPSPLSTYHSNQNQSSTTNEPLNNATDHFHQPSAISIHPMTTHLQRGISKPITKLNLHAQLTDVELPKNITQALKSPIWRKAMETEMSALLENKTWDLVPSSPSHNIISI